MMSDNARRVLTALAVSFCASSANAQDELTLSTRTLDALVHVVAHEIGHAVLREFDLPVLGPEEAIADDFATVYVQLMFPDRAEAIVSARADQDIADNEETEPFSEYIDDDWRAGRSVCVLYGLDPERYAGLRDRYGMDEDDASNCEDLAPEVGRSWRRIIENYRMPKGVRVTEAYFAGDDIPLTTFIVNSQLSEDAGTMLRAIDWHSQITLAVEACEGSGGWSRNGRRITICGTYVERFERQLGQ